MGKRKKSRRLRDWSNADFRLGHIAVSRDEYRRPVIIGEMIERHQLGVIIRNPSTRERKFARWDQLDPPIKKKWPHHVSEG